MNAEGGAAAPSKYKSKSSSNKQQCVGSYLLTPFYSQKNVYILLYLFFLDADANQAGPVNSVGDAKPANQMDAIKKEQLKKDLGKRMSGKLDIINGANKKENTSRKFKIYSCFFII